MGSEERAARNEVVFRQANEELGRKRQELELQGTTPFICECEDESCTQFIRLELAEYERVRGHPRRFVVVPGHDAEGHRPVERHERYVVVEKTGSGGELAEREDPRR